MNFSKPPSSPPAHLFGVLRSLWQWRKPIIITTVVGTVLAVIISLVLPVYYQSSTSFLAINPEVNTIDGIFGNSAGNIQIYGNGDDIERLLAIAESDKLVDYMVETFDLYEVYDIDPTGVKAPLSVSREFLGNYEVSKSPRDVIELSIMDQDPDRVADMAARAREKVNEISVSIIRASQFRTAESLRGEIEKREENLKEISTTLENLRSTSGIFNPTAQGEALSTMSSTRVGEIAFTEAKIDAYRARGGRGARDSIAKLEIALAGLISSQGILDSQLVQLNMNMGPMANLDEERLRLNNAVSYDRIRLKQYETLLRTDQRALETVEDAKVPVVKIKPVRSLIVLGGMVFSFLAALLGVLLIEGGRKYNWEEIFR